MLMALPMDLRNKKMTADKERCTHNSMQSDCLHALLEVLAMCWAGMLTWKAAVQLPW